MKFSELIERSGPPRQHRRSACARGSFAAAVERGIEVTDLPGTDLTDLPGPPLDPAELAAIRERHSRLMAARILPDLDQQQRYRALLLVVVGEGAL